MVRGMYETEHLLHEWVEANMAREDTDTDQTKAQALAAGRFVLAFADARPHTAWEQIPVPVRRAALDLMIDEASKYGLAINKTEIGKQARVAISCDFQFPECAATKIMIEAYTGSAPVREHKRRVLDGLLMIAAGEPCDTVPDNVVERINRRRAAGKRYTVTLHDFYEAQGRRSYLAGSRQTSEEQVDNQIEQMTGERPKDRTNTPTGIAPAAAVVRETNDWWEEVVKGRMAIRRALDMLTARDNVQPHPLAVQALTSLSEDIAGMVAILDFRNADEVRV